MNQPFGKAISIVADRILSVDEACKFLRIKRSLFYTLLADKENPIPSIKIGGRRCFLQSSILNWAKSNETHG